MTQIVTITMSGPVRQGWLILNTVDRKGGGRTGIGAFIQNDQWGTPPTWETVATLLRASMMRPEWPEFLKAVTVSKNRLRIAVPDGITRLDFSADFDPDMQQGAGPVPREEPIIRNPDFVAIEDEIF